MTDYIQKWIDEIRERMKKITELEGEIWGFLDDIELHSSKIRKGEINNG